MLNSCVPLREIVGSACRGDSKKKRWMLCDELVSLARQEFLIGETGL